MTTAARTRLCRVAFCGALAGLAVLPHWLSPYWRVFLTEALIWCLLAMSFNLLYGYVGLLTFGQAMFFGMGGYGVALLLSRAGWSLLPAFMGGTFLAVLFAAIVGVFIIRLHGHAFVLMTVILSLALFYLFVNQSQWTGGDDGFPFTVPPLHIGAFRVSLVEPTVNYYVVLSLVSAGFLGYWWLVASSGLGAAWPVLRDNEEQAELLSYDPRVHKFIAFVCAGTLAGLAGALYALTFRYANALWLHWTVSGEAVVWTVVGGAGTLLGPVIGTTLLLLLKDVISSWNEHAYPLFVGIILILTIRAMPKGLMGAAREWFLEPDSLLRRTFGERLAAAMERRKGKASRHWQKRIGM